MSVEIKNTGPAGVSIELIKFAEDGWGQERELPFAIHRLAAGESTTVDVSGVYEGTKITIRASGAP